MNLEEAKNPRCKAFARQRCLAAGEVVHVARETKLALEQGETAPILIFDEATSRLVEIDFRGTVEEVVHRLEASHKSVPVEAEAETDKRKPGRPKLGVVPREVTLLPRHWEWLNEQPGGASVALRKLVEEARHARHWIDRVRQAQESVHRFMTAMAGDLPGFEEALRAFYAKDDVRFDELIETWPKDIRDHVRQLAAAVKSAGAQG